MTRYIDRDGYTFAKTYSKYVSLCWNFKPTIIKDHWELSYNIATPEHGTGVFYNYFHLRLGRWLTAKLYLPRLIKPYLLIKPSGYKVWMDRKYGFVIRQNGDFHSVYYGIRPDDDSYRGQAPYNFYNYFPGYKHTRLVKSVVFKPNGAVYGSINYRKDIRGKQLSELREIEHNVPKKNITISDYDGEIITASYHVREDTREHGTGEFKWLSWITKNKKQKYIRLSFDKEVGTGKGSWKGGLLGVTINIEKHESTTEAILRWINTEKQKDNKNSSSRIDVSVIDWYPA